MPKHNNDIRLPNELILFHNADKGFHEVYDPNKLGRWPHPYRACLLAGLNSGKSNLVLNLVLQQKFEKIYLLHLDVSPDDPDGSREYSQIDCEILTDVPSPKDFDKKTKNLLIVEEYNLKSLPKDQAQKLDRLLGYVSTHRNTSIIMTQQNPMSVPLSLRRMCNYICLWGSTDNVASRVFNERLHMEKGELSNLLRTHCHTPYDFLVICLNGGDEPFIRKNLFEVIKQSKNDP